MGASSRLPSGLTSCRAPSPYTWSCNENKRSGDQNWGTKCWETKLGTLQNFVWEKHGIPSCFGFMLERSHKPGSAHDPDCSREQFARRAVGTNRFEKL